MTETLAEQFDAALVLRDSGRYDEAIALLSSLVNLLDASPEQRRLFVHSHVQIAHMLEKLGDRVRRRDHLQIAVTTAPRFELASLAFFHALIALDRFGEAMEEMVRFVSESNSDGYRELLSEGFDDDLAPTDRALAERARTLLARFS